MKNINKDALKSKLAGLYADLSKHSSYQSIPDFVASVLGYQVQINEDWRGDRVRLDYILSRLPDPANRLWGDFGANTGFFSLSIARAWPEREVLAIEANPNHADFIRRVGDAFDVRNLQVIGRPIAIDELETIPRRDVLLHLNVLHHAGSDFDQGRVTGPDDFLHYAREYLQRLRASTRVLVFQVGTNLWGDKAKPIIDFRDDAGKLAMLSDLLTASGWQIDDVAYPTRQGSGRIHYQPLPGTGQLAKPGEPGTIASALESFALDDHIGEFYRRPLFFCTSL